MLTGRVLHYEVHERTGAGAMGEVYRATDTQFDREAASRSF